MTILSPNYPHYRKYSDCEWVLIVPCNKQIELHFEEFEIELHRDYLDICDEDIMGDTTRCQEYTGTDTPEAFLSKGNHVSLKFKSDFINNFKGFRIKINIFGNTNLIF